MAAAVVAVAGKLEFENDVFDGVDADAATDVDVENGVGVGL